MDRRVVFCPLCQKWQRGIVRHARQEHAEMLARLDIPGIAQLFGVHKSTAARMRRGFDAGRQVVPVFCPRCRTMVRSVRQHLVEVHGRELAAGRGMGLSFGQIHDWLFGGGLCGKAELIRSHAAVPEEERLWVEEELPKRLLVLLWDGDGPQVARPGMKGIGLICTEAAAGALVLIHRRRHGQEEEEEL